MIGFLGDFEPHDKFWNDNKNQRKFMDWAGKQLNIKDMSDWYKVTTQVAFSALTRVKIQEITNLGGGNALKLHHYSMFPLLSSTYPEYEWLPWKFSKCPKNFWEDKGNQRKFMDWAGKELEIKEMNDWYKVTNQVYFQVEWCG